MRSHSMEPGPTLAALRDQPTAEPAPGKATLLGEGGGEPLGTRVRGQMETAFGADFSAVRVHRDSSAARSLGAHAFTRGADLHFATGAYAPDSASGQELIGHELAHVVQQAEGRVRANVQAKGLPVNDDGGLEAEADEQGARAARGEPVRTGVTAVTSGGGVLQGKFKITNGKIYESEEDVEGADAYIRAKISGTTNDADSIIAELKAMADTGDHGEGTWTELIGMADKRVSSGGGKGAKKAPAKKAPAKKAPAKKAPAKKAVNWKDQFDYDSDDLADKQGLSDDDGDGYEVYKTTDGTKTNIPIMPLDKASQRVARDIRSYRGEFDELEDEDRRDHLNETADTPIATNVGGETMLLRPIRFRKDVCAFPTKRSESGSLMQKGGKGETNEQLAKALDKLAEDEELEMEDVNADIEKMLQGQKPSTSNEELQEKERTLTTILACDNARSSRAKDKIQEQVLDDSSSSFKERIGSGEKYIGAPKGGAGKLKEYTAQQKEAAKKGVKRKRTEDEASTS